MLGREDEGLFRKSRLRQKFIGCLIIMILIMGHHILISNCTALFIGAPNGIVKELFPAWLQTFNTVRLKNRITM